MKHKNREIFIILAACLLFFLCFLIYPAVRLLVKSLLDDSGATLSNYISVFSQKDFVTALRNSLFISSVNGIVTTIIAFFLAYTVHYTNVHKYLKSAIKTVTLLPMLLPTITYGFAIIYSFGKQGFLTKLFGHQLFDIYGFNGLILGYVIYTLPVAFMLILNAMSYIDKNFMIVSRVMGDKGIKTFFVTIVRPLLGTLAASFIQCFFLSFTDFGIPASVGGEYSVVAGTLYNTMLGSVPDFGKGSVIAVMMLVPSVISIAALHILEKYNVRYNKRSKTEIKNNVFRDTVFGMLSSITAICVLSVFAVIFIVPFVREWPYNIIFTLEHVVSVFQDSALLNVYKHSIWTALLTAVFGTLTAYGAALVTSRSTINPKVKGIIESMALVTNTIPGMVIGLAYLFCFSGSRLQGTFAIIIICNIVHFFSTPYLMIKSTLSKMNSSWETTAMLMGDNWLKTIVRVVAPNSISTIMEAFGYYFINAMVTVSAVIFIAGARTMVITAKIKELQYFNKFNEIFVLSLLILFTNLIAKIVFHVLASKKIKTK